MDFDNKRVSGCKFKWKKGTLYHVNNNGTSAGPLQSLYTYNRSHLLEQLCQWQLFCAVLISLNHMTTVGSTMNTLICEILKLSVASEISLSPAVAVFFSPPLRGKAYSATSQIAHYLSLHSWSNLDLEVVTWPEDSQTRPTSCLSTVTYWSRFAWNISPKQLWLREYLKDLGRRSIKTKIFFFFC